MTSSDALLGQVDEAAQGSEGGPQIRPARARSKPDRSGCYGPAAPRGDRRRGPVPAAADGDSVVVGEQGVVVGVEDLQVVEPPGQRPEECQLALPPSSSARRVNTRARSDSRSMEQPGHLAMDPRQQQAGEGVERHRQEQRQAIGCTGKSRPHHAHASNQRASSTVGPAAEQIQTTNERATKNRCCTSTSWRTSGRIRAVRPSGSRQARRRRCRCETPPAARTDPGGTGSRSRPRTAVENGVRPHAPRPCSGRTSTNAEQTASANGTNKAQSGIQLAQPEPRSRSTTRDGARGSSSPYLAGRRRRFGRREAGRQRRPVDFLLQLLQLLGRHHMGVFEQTQVLEAREIDQRLDRDAGAVDRPPVCRSRARGTPPRPEVTTASPTARRGLSGRKTRAGRPVLCLPGSPDRATARPSPECGS